MTTTWLLKKGSYYWPPDSLSLSLFLLFYPSVPSAAFLAVILAASLTLCYSACCHGPLAHVHT